MCKDLWSEYYIFFLSKQNKLSVCDKTAWLSCIESTTVLSIRWLRSHLIQGLH